MDGFGIYFSWDGIWFSNPNVGILWEIGKICKKPQTLRKLKIGGRCGVDGF